MSRLIKEDFGKLCTFVKEYRLSDVLENEDAKKLLSSYHKKYFAYLVLIEEIHHEIERKDKVVIGSPAKVCGDKILNMPFYRS